MSLPGTPDRILVRIWDLPLRLFHWSLVLFFALAYLTGGEEGYYPVHKAAGIAILGLLIFRIFWGFVGGRSARFATFLRGPRAVVDHLRELAHRRHQAADSHNPLGGWAVVVMLILILFEVISGLFSSTFDYEGPLARLLPDVWTGVMANLHALNSSLLIAMVALHLTGIAATSILGRENLVAGMMHGGRRLPMDLVRSGHDVPWWRAALIAAVAAGLVWALLSIPRFLG
jgi:cytochrome b